MQPKISKTLEGIIARSAFNTTKAGITHSLKDFLALELLREEGLFRQIYDMQMAIGEEAET